MEPGGFKHRRDRAGWKSGELLKALRGWVGFCPPAGRLRRNELPLRLLSAACHFFGTQAVAFWLVPGTLGDVSGKRSGVLHARLLDSTCRHVDKRAACSGDFLRGDPAPGFAQAVTPYDGGAPVLACPGGLRGRQDNASRTVATPRNVQ